MSMITTRTICLSRNRVFVEGLTLTEFAVVLGIIGLVLAAIWGAAAMVFNGKKITTAASELNVISHNMHMLYAEQNGVTETAVNALTMAMDQLQVFPLDMRRQNPGTPAGILLDPWNDFMTGSVFVDADNCAGTAVIGAIQPCFSVTFLSVPHAACTALLVQTTQNSMGLQQVNVNGNVAGVVGGGFGLPVLASIANTSCDDTDNGNNDIKWIYLLKGGGT